ncbi:unnamed protein product [Rotaria sp. Silwood2]|nr:unnamed protein product [Rotaria sp. Silwood2]
MFLLLLLLLSTNVLSVWGHGFLFDPPARSTAWIVIPDFRSCCTYYDHMQMFCGGVPVQYGENSRTFSLFACTYLHLWHLLDGKCGICGEPYNQVNKLFEMGGSMYKGTSVKTYNQGQQISVKVNLTANHMGYFEFHLCNVDTTPNSDATQDCLDRRILKLANSDLTKYSITGAIGNSQIIVNLQLPAGVSCQHCVFQWKYTAGNSWGTDPITGQQGLGLGTENETFMGCADITIVGGSVPASTSSAVTSSTKALVYS